MVNISFLVHHIVLREKKFLCPPLFTLKMRIHQCNTKPIFTLKMRMHENRISIRGDFPLEKVA